MEVPIDRLAFVALAKSSSTDDDVSAVTVLMGVDGGARNSIGDGGLAILSLN